MTEQRQGFAQTDQHGKDNFFNGGLSNLVINRRASMIESFVIGSIIIMTILGGVLVRRARREIAAWDAINRRCEADIRKKCAHD